MNSSYLMPHSIHEDIPLLSLGFPFTMLIIISITSANFKYLSLILIFLILHITLLVLGPTLSSSLKPPLLVLYTLSSTIFIIKLYRNRSKFLQELHRYFNTLSFWLLLLSIAVFLTSTITKRIQFAITLSGDSKIIINQEAPEKGLQLFSFSILMFAVIELYNLTREEKTND